MLQNHAVNQTLYLSYVSLLGLFHSKKVGIWGLRKICLPCFFQKHPLKSRIPRTAIANCRPLPLIFFQSRSKYFLTGIALEQSMFQRISVAIRVKIICHYCKLAVNQTLYFCYFIRN